MISQQEQLFYNKIHCNFPCDDRNACLKLIEEAISLHSDSMFKVIEEICRYPHPNKVKKEDLIFLLNFIDSKFEHPLKSMVLEVAEKMVFNDDMEVEIVIQKFHIIKKYKRQYSALDILYFSCDDTQERLEPIMKEILDDWKNE